MYRSTVTFGFIMQIQITTQSTTPIFRQIVDQLRRQIASGQLAVGDALPSVRQLAKDLVINPNTVAKAYAELQRDGLIESRQGRGVFVAKRRIIFTKTERTRRLDDAIERFAAEALSLDFSNDEILERISSKLEQLTHEPG
jgi:GntR family transcriptional regulator